jgi:hypothetical protein
MKQEMDSRNGDGDGGDDMITIPFVMLIPRGTVTGYQPFSRKIQWPPGNNY